jgi:hypothetical protein
MSGPAGMTPAEVAKMTIPQVLNYLRPSEENGWPKKPKEQVVAEYHANHQKRKARKEEFLRALKKKTGQQGISDE